MVKKKIIKILCNFNYERKILLIYIFFWFCKIVVFVRYNRFLLTMFLVIFILASTKFFCFSVFVCMLFLFILIIVRFLVNFLVLMVVIFLRGMVFGRDEDLLYDVRIFYLYNESISLLNFKMKYNYLTYEIYIVYKCFIFRYFWIIYMLVF